MNCLIDVNVWIALATPGHIHHTPAIEWFQTSLEDRFAFCRVTQMGFLRLVTNPRVMGTSAVNAEEAWSAFDAFMRDDRIDYEPEPIGMETLWRAQVRGRQTGGSFWTDAYLAAFAAAAGLTIVTFDRQFTRGRNVSVRLLA